MAAKPKKPKTAQDLCSELFREVEQPMSDAWISDDSCTDSPAEYLTFVEGHLAALEEARVIIKKFLRKHRGKVAHPTPEQED